MSYRYINTSFWEDPFIESLSPEGKLVYLYLITRCPNQCGIFEISYQRMSFETGYPIDTISKILDTLSEKGKIFIDGNFIFIKNFLKYQANKSPKVIEKIKKELEQFKNRPALLKEFNKVANTLSIPYQYPIDTLSIPYEYHNDNIPIPPSEKEKEKEKEIEIEEGSKVDKGKYNNNQVNIDSNEHAKNDENLKKSPPPLNDDEKNFSCPDKEENLPENVVSLKSVIDKITKNKPYPYHDDIKPTLVDYNFAKYMRDYFKQKVAHFNITQRELEVWATHVARIRRKFHVNESDLIRVFEYAMLDPFWSQVISNPYHLYKNWNQLVSQKSAKEEPYYELKRKIEEKERKEKEKKNAQAGAN